MRQLLLLLIAAVVWFVPRPAAAQNVYVSTPLVNANESFYEWFNVDWGYQSRGRNGNFFFNRGSSLATAPVFGGFDPASAARLGVRVGGFNFNFTAAQGNNRTITSSTPSVNLYNGAVGSVRDVQMRPFVTGLIPVVGSTSGYRVPAPTLISPLSERLARLREQQARQARQPAPAIPVAAGNGAPDNRAADNGAPDNRAAAAQPPALDDLVLGAPEPVAQRVPVSGTGSSTSTAQRGDISVAEIRRQQAARAQAEAEELAALIESAEAAEAVGSFGAARARYRQAAARATGDRKRALLEKLDSIRDR